MVAIEVEVNLFVNVLNLEKLRPRLVRLVRRVGCRFLGEGIATAPCMASMRERRPTFAWSSVTSHLNALDAVTFVRERGVSGPALR